MSEVNSNIQVGGEGEAAAFQKYKDSDGLIGRELYDHKRNKFNRECVEVRTADSRANDNAHHKYTIQVWKHAQTSEESSICVEAVTLNFQNGGLKEVGPNGITDQALLAIVMDRLKSFNDGQFRCRENSLAITHLELVLMYMEERANDRARRGAEGERKQ